MRSVVSLALRVRGICSLALGSGRRSLSAPRPTHRSPNFGGIHDAPPGREKDLDVIELARFAVAEHNAKANASLEFERVVKVRIQLVAGYMHYFTIQVKDGGYTKLYEAKVWEKSWENFKGLQEFRPIKI